MRTVILFSMAFFLFQELALAGENEDSAILDNMYDNLFKSLPISQRQFIDSVNNTKKVQYNGEKNVAVSDTHQSGSNTDPVMQSEKLNQQLQKMIQQIDTMRQERLLHFMSTDKQ